MAMLRILQEEESNYGEAGTTGACLEYLLQHRLLETLYTLGRTDVSSIAHVGQGEGEWEGGGGNLGFNKVVAISVPMKFARSFNSISVK